MQYTTEALNTLEFFINYHKSVIEKFKNNKNELIAGKLAVMAAEANTAIEIYEFSKKKILIHK